MNMEGIKEVAVLFGTESIGQAIIRRIGVEKQRSEFLFSLKIYRKSILFL